MKNDSYAEKKFKNLIQGGSGAFGNAATRLEMLAVKGGTYAYGSYPDLDELFQRQAAELDKQHRETILHKMQQIVHERTMMPRSGSSPLSTGTGRGSASQGSG